MRHANSVSQTSTLRSIVHLELALELIEVPQRDRPVGTVLVGLVLGQQPVEVRVQRDRVGLRSPGLAVGAQEPERGDAALRPTARERSERDLRLGVGGLDRGQACVHQPRCETHSQPAAGTLRPQVLAAVRLVQHRVAVDLGQRIGVLVGHVLAVVAERDLRAELAEAGGVRSESRARAACRSRRAGRRTP